MKILNCFILVLSFYLLSFSSTAQGEFDSAYLAEAFRDVPYIF